MFNTNFMKLNRLAISALILLFAFFSACVKESSFPDVPVIAFERFELINSDTANCYISFTDGDGDVGILDNDTVSEPDLVMKYLYKDTDGEFKAYDANPGTSEFDTLFYNNRIPNLTSIGQFKALEGEIQIKLRSSPIFSPFHEVVMFEIRMRDRAGNWSNTVFTDEIIVNQ